MKQDILGLEHSGVNNGKKYNSLLSAACLCTCALHRPLSLPPSRPFFPLPHIFFIFPGNFLLSCCQSHFLRHACCVSLRTHLDSRKIKFLQWRLMLPQIVQILTSQLFSSSLWGIWAIRRSEFTVLQPPP